MVPNIHSTIGHKINTRKHPRHGTQCGIQYPKNRNPTQSLQENAITALRPRLYNSMPKYLRDLESVKTEKFKFELEKFQELIPDERKMSNYVTASPRKQQHPQPANSSEGSRNLSKWCSPRLGHGAVLAVSKPLQVFKYVVGFGAFKIFKLYIWGSTIKISCFSYLKKESITQKYLYCPFNIHKSGKIQVCNPT